MLQIRNAQFSDSKDIAVLLAQLGYPSSVEEVNNRLRYLENQVDHATFVAAVDSGVVGWVHVCVRYHLTENPFAEISGLVVDEKLRSTGIGFLLLESAEKWAVDHQCNHIWVRSNILRERAHGFYEKHGYRRLKTQHVYLKELVVLGGMP